MADVTTSTFIKGWTRGGVNGKRQRVVMADLVGTFTAGTTANKILATAFQGLKVIEEVITAVADDNSKLYVLTPAYDGSYLLHMDVVNVTDATKNSPGDVTVTSPRKMRVVVAGY